MASQQLCGMWPAHLQWSVFCNHRPSLLNHSCEPNCVVVFDGPLLHLRTIREIQPGEQVHSHIMPTSPCTFLPGFLLASFPGLHPQLLGMRLVFHPLQYTSFIVQAMKTDANVQGGLMLRMHLTIVFTIFSAVQLVCQRLRSVFSLHQPIR